MTKTLMALALLLLPSSPVMAQQPPAPPALTVTPLGSGLFLLGGGSNAVLAVGDDGVILVDTKFRDPDALVELVASVTDLPVRYVINTHAHPDHVGGNTAFAALGATVVATERAAAWMTQPFLNPRGGFDPPVPDAGRPGETFTGRHGVSIPGQAADVVEVERSHSEGDAYVYFPGANVLVMGDLHHSNEYPVYDVTMGCECGSFEGNLRAYDEMLALADDDTRIVPGHGGLTNKREVAAYVGMLRRIRDQVDLLIAQGRSEDDVVAMRLLADDRSPTSPGPDNRDDFIRTLYRAQATGRGR